jgi:Uma2 family endonuclease
MTQQLAIPKTPRLKMDVVNSNDQVDLPLQVADYDSFQDWLHSDVFPDKGKICFIRNSVWVDLSMEEFFTHGLVITEIGRVLATLLKETKFGNWGKEGTRYSHPESKLSTEPDGMVISFEAVSDGTVRFRSGPKGDKTEVIGSPEIVIEVVSASSEIKDTQWAMTAYFEAGVQEYWLADARNESELRFDIFKRQKKQFVASRKQQGWVKSGVLNKSFRLLQSLDDNGNPEYLLDVR